MEVDVSGGLNTSRRGLASAYSEVAGTRIFASQSRSSS